jgi:hypothetical protein
MGDKAPASMRISKGEIKAALGRVINSPHKELIVETILGNLQSDAQVRKMTFALMGIERQLPCKVLSTIWVKVNHLPTWRVDIKKMRQRGMFFQEKTKALVKRISPTDDESIEIEFLAINSGSDTITLENYTVSGLEVELCTEEIDFTE